MDSQLKELALERGRIKSALTRFRNFFDSSANTTSIEILEKRLKLNEPLHDKFDEIQSRIETLAVGSDIETIHAKERDEFEVAYFEIITRVEQHIAQFRRARSTPISSSSSPAIKEPPVTPRLPTIVLPEFNGDYNDWLRFRDTFESLIHNNETLSDIQRFHYLNSALKGPAARVTQSLGVSEANYRIAWSALKNRFEDPRSLVHHHTNALLDLPIMQKQTSSSLREFIDTANNHIRALGALGEPVQTWDTLLISILSKKLDPFTAKKWEERVVTMPGRLKLHDLVDFLEQQSKLLERTTTNRQPTVNLPNLTNKIDTTKPRIKTQFGVASHLASTQVQCIFCKGEHWLQYCDKLKAMPHAQLHDTIKRLQCCFNCLQLGHSIKNCTRGHCRRCGKKHHTLLHRDDATPQTREPSHLDSQAIASTSQVQSCLSGSKTPAIDFTVLSTALIHIEDSFGKRHECCALLDAGSQAHFITEDLCSKLRLPLKSTAMTVGGVGRSINPINSRTEVVIRSVCNTFKSNLSCLVIENITENMPNVPLNRSNIPIPDGITIADPHFNEPKRIDLLIGAGLFWQLLCIGQHKVGNGLVWQKTRFGWVLGGSLSWPINYPIVNANTCHIANDELHRAISRFWEIEDGHSNQLEASNHLEDYGANHHNLAHLSSQQ
ncbi:uncharacterized protein LOC122404315 [Colletes gigas]|uniref:uncharacterized protein LOC122404315 n=1 Tax=Colletes gigas TaxID=935657 RepID=UPI001C9AAE71|nr:uncharacterized protein LOC122404315 [Colletes gigas]